MSVPPPDRLTFSNIISNFFRDLTNADRGMWGTIVQLTVRPQRVINTFLFEDRARFIRPTRYVLFALSVAALSFVAIQWRYGQPIQEYLRPTIERQAEESVASLRQSFEERLDLTDPASLEQKRQANAKMIAGIREEAIKVNTNAIKYGNYLGILFMPLAAFAYWFMFPRKRFNFAEHLASVGYIYSHASLLNLLTLPFILLATSPDGLIRALLYASILQGIYQLYATARVYVKSWSDLFIGLGALIAFTIGIILLVKSSAYLIGYVAGSYMKKDCTECFFNYWNLLKPVPAILFMGSLLFIRLKPNKWHFGLVAGLVGLVLAVVI